MFSPLFFFVGRMGIVVDEDSAVGLGVEAIGPGAFLPARGAIHTALSESGFAAQEIRRSWHALWSGQWHIYELISHFRELVLADAQWQPSSCDGWRPVAVDLSTPLTGLVYMLRWTPHYEKRKKSKR